MRDSAARQQAGRDAQVTELLCLGRDVSASTYELSLHVNTRVSKYTGLSGVGSPRHGHEQACAAHLVCGLCHATQDGQEVGPCSIRLRIRLLHQAAPPKCIAHQMQAAGRLPGNLNAKRKMFSIWAPCSHVDATCYGNGRVSHECLSPDPAGGLFPTSALPVRKGATFLSVLELPGSLILSTPAPMSGLETAFQLAYDATSESITANVGGEDVGTVFVGPASASGDIDAFFVLVSGYLVRSAARFDYVFPVL